MKNLLRFTSLSLVLASCKPEDRSPASAEQSDTVQDPAKGKALAQLHCTRCHLCPQPSELPSQHWPFVLEWMGHYVGTETQDNPEIGPLLTPSLLVDTTVMDQDSWNSLKAYFMGESTKEADPTQVYAHIAPPSSLFRKGTAFEYSDKTQSVSAIYAHPEEKVIYASDTNRNEVVRYSFKGDYLSRGGPFSSQIGALIPHGKDVLLIQTGHLYNKGNEGAVFRFGPRQTRAEKIIDGLPRLAHARPMDQTASEQDLQLIISAFGDGDPGALLLAPVTTGQTEELLSLRGCVDAHPCDLDQDGDQDILALFTQGQQQMWLLRKKNDGPGYHKEMLWQRRPGQGYTGFQPVDLNNDGHLDIVTFSGNNMEIPDPPVRPYHGVHIFAGDSTGNFVEKDFFGLPGAIALEIADFNHDGRPDLLCLSNFPDWRSPSPCGAMLLLNKGNLSFQAEALPLEISSPYFSAEAVDIDEDGDLDLLLGAFRNCAVVIAPKKEAHAEAALRAQENITLLINTTR